MKTFTEGLDEGLNKLSKAWVFRPRLNAVIDAQQGEYSGAEQAKQGIVKYVKGCLNIGGTDARNYACSRRGCARFFGPHGQMGKGKTRLQIELCKQEALCTAEDFGDYDVQFVRISYGEGFEAFPGTAIHTFARNLLVFHGMTQGAAEQVHSLDAAVKLLWKKVPWRSVHVVKRARVVYVEEARIAKSARVLSDKGKIAKHVLVVCIDELLSMRQEYGEQMVTLRSTPQKLITKDFQRGDLMHKLAVFSEESFRTARPVIFLFSSATAGMLAAAAKISRRSFVDPPFLVPELKPTDMLETLWEHWPHLKERYKRDTVLKHVVHLCLSVPRALFDGIPAAFPCGGGTVTMERAIQTVVDKAALAHKDIDRLFAENVVKWWVCSMELPNKDKLAELVQWGVATPSQLKPLALRYWCDDDCDRESKSQSLVAHFLREVYVADMSVEPYQEKKAEEVLYNFEAAKRVSYAHKKFSLAEYYRGGSVRGVSADVSAFPSQTAIVKDNQVVYVDTFADAKKRGSKKKKNSADDVNKSQTRVCLERGSIVVSKKANEPGIEYLVPFFESKQLKYVAAVQVKFSPDKQISGGCKDICDTAMKVPIVKYLQEKGVTCFPVLLSTSHGLSRNECEVKHGVLYDDVGLAGFTKCLGPLRLHREKASAEHVAKMDDLGKNGAHGTHSFF